MLSHPHVIKSLIANYCIKLRLYDVDGGSNTELSHKVITRVSVYGIHIDMLKKFLLDCTWHMMKSDLSVFVILLFNYFFHLKYEI